MTKIERKQTAHRNVMERVYQMAGQMLRDATWCERYAAFHYCTVRETVMNRRETWSYDDYGNVVFKLVDSYQV
jgi:hypothetical protein